MPNVSYIFIVLALSLFVFGPSSLIYLVISYIISFIIGTWAENEINKADTLTREMVKEVTGNESEGSAKELGQFIVKVNKAVGVFIPIIPAITACVALYLSFKNKRMTSCNYGSRSTNRRVNPVIFH